MGPQYEPQLHPVVRFPSGVFPFGAITISFTLTLPMNTCSTMGVGCQSRRFNCLFWRETRQRILGHEISPYPEVVRGGEWELTTRPREKQLVTGQEQKQLGVGGWRAERQAAEVGVEERRGSQHQTPSREARRQDRVQWRRVSRCLIPVALWNFR